MNSVAASILLLLAACQLLGQGLIRIEGPFAALDGETCVVCNGRTSSQDLAYRVNGQRVAVMRGMEEDVLKNPAKYVAALKPEGLFSSAGRQTPGGQALLWLGTLVLIGLLCGAMCSHLAMARGLSPWSWFFLGLGFSLLAVAVLWRKPVVAAAPVGMNKVPSTRAPMPCPKCGDWNHPSATRCLGCGNVLTPTASSEVPAVH
jgi:hypothetical protein